MDWLEELKKQLQIRREKLILGIKSAKQERDGAPSAMESHSDTTKSEKEKLIFALENDLKKLEDVIHNIPNNLNNLNNNLLVSEWKYVEILLDGNLMKVCIVTEGVGGDVINNIRLVSSKTLLGKEIINKKKGDKFSFNGKNGIIREIK